MRFQEGDKVRNVRFEMGPGVITRHGEGPRSIRWASHGTEAWWVVWPQFRDPRWVNPDERGTSGWANDSGLVLDENVEHTRVLYESAEAGRKAAYDAWRAAPRGPDWNEWVNRFEAEPYARPARTEGERDLRAGEIILDAQHGRENDMTAERETCDYPNCHDPAVGKVGRFNVCRTHKREFAEFMRATEGRAT